jgi:hypothetical protein
MQAKTNGHGQYINAPPVVDFFLPVHQQTQIILLPKFGHLHKQSLMSYLPAHESFYLRQLIAFMHPRVQ